MQPANTANSANGIRIFSILILACAIISIGFTLPAHAKSAPNTDAKTEQDYECSVPANSTVLCARITVGDLSNLQAYWYPGPPADNALWQVRRADNGALLDQHILQPGDLQSLWRNTTGSSVTVEIFITSDVSRLVEFDLDLVL